MRRTITLHVLEHRDGQHYAYALAYPFEHDDGGQAQATRRGRERNACTVRALAIIVQAMNRARPAGALPGFNYDTALAHLEAEGREYGRGARLEDLLSVLDRLAYTTERRSFPARRGERRMNPATFCRQHPSGVWLLNMARHVSVCVDGIIRDAEPLRPDACIYTAYRID